MLNTNTKVSIYISDKFPLKKSPQKLYIIFESRLEKPHKGKEEIWEQGVYISSDKKIEYAGQSSKKFILSYNEIAPPIMEIICHDKEKVLRGKGLSIIFKSK